MIKSDIGNASSNSSSRGGSRTGIELGQLLHAAALGEVGAIKGLLDEGIVDVNQADYDGRTALHLAASEGKVEAVRALLERGADPNPKDRYGNTVGAPGAVQCIRVRYYSAVVLDTIVHLC